MALITIQDLSGSGNLDLGDSSPLQLFGLKGMKANSNDLVAKFQEHLDNKDITFKSAEVELDLANPKISVPGPETLNLKASRTASLTMFRSSDSPLLGDGLSLKIPLKEGECAFGFEMKTSVDVGAAVKLPNGFGVSVKDSSAAIFDSYTLFDARTAPATTFQDALSRTISNFSLIARGTDIRKQPAGTVNTCDVQGSITIGGTWTLPVSLNPAALAEVKIPITVSVQPTSQIQLKGTVKLSGQYSVRCWKESDSSATIGVYKKKGTEFTVSFDSEIGVTAGPEGMDLVSTVLSAIGPGVSTSVLAGDGDAIKGALRECVDNSLSVSLNASCSASVADEAAIVYKVDLSGQDDAVDHALEAALAGDWRPIATLKKAIPVINSVCSTDTTTNKLIINLLGVYNYESLSEFVKRSQMVHSPGDHSLTLTDTATAKRIAVAGTPYRADDEQLRRVLAESNICTAAYSFAQNGSSETLGVKQDLLIYKSDMDQAGIRRKLKAGSAAGFIENGQIESATAANQYKHVLIHVTQDFAPHIAQDMFFADPKARTSHDVRELRALARNILISLLDPYVDQQRIRALGDGWSDDQEPPPGPLRVDHLDVVWWASAVHNVAAPLAAAMDAFSKLPTGQDASQDKDFTAKRKALVSALEDVANKTHSGFEDGFALALMYSLSRAQSTGSFSAAWNGTKHFDIKRTEPAPVQVSRSSATTSSTVITPSNL